MENVWFISALWIGLALLSCICALFGITNGIINQDQYTVLVTAVIASAVVPTLIAQQWFQPELKTEEEEDNA